jgi:nicotinate-nucleotide adenylyltransferase
MSERMLMMGGTFDPVHVGHLLVARAVAERMEIDRVVLVPTGKPPHKAAPSASGVERLEMLHLATAGDHLFDIWDLELQRSGPSYTFDTVEAIRREIGPEPQLYWLVGMDMLADLPRWHRASELLELTDIVTAARAPWQQRMGEILARLGRAFSAQKIQRLHELVVPTPVIEISSSDIRLRVRQGLPISYMVMPMVETYIEDIGLYLRADPEQAQEES